VTQRAVGEGDLQARRQQEEEKTMGTMAKTRRLYRSRTDRKLAGVCGGLSQYFNTDATLIRVLFVVLALLGGPGLVIYLLMWILVPEEPEDAA
jgi:phage shock protein PspC (stress-responsive transcriptional regulator)